MLTVRDCRHICLCCEYFSQCKEEIEAERGQKDENAIHEKK